MKRSRSKELADCDSILDSHSGFWFIAPVVRTKSPKIADLQNMTLERDETQDSLVDQLEALPEDDTTEILLRVFPEKVKTRYDSLKSEWDFHLYKSDIDKDDSPPFLPVPINTRDKIAIIVGWLTDGMLSQLKAHLQEYMAITQPSKKPAQYTEKLDTINIRKSLANELEQLPEEDIVDLLLQVLPEDIKTRYHDLLANNHPDENENVAEEESSGYHLTKRLKIAKAIEAVSPEKLYILENILHDYKKSHNARY